MPTSTKMIRATDISRVPATGFPPFGPIPSMETRAIRITTIPRIDNQFIPIESPLLAIYADFFWSLAASFNADP